MGDLCSASCLGNSGFGRAGISTKGNWRYPGDYGNLADALLEVPDGQDFTSVVEVYVNGVRTETPLKELAVEDGDLFEFVYAASQIEGN